MWIPTFFINCNITFARNFISIGGFPAPTSTTHEKYFRVYGAQ